MTEYRWRAIPGSSEQPSAGWSATRPNAGDWDPDSLLPPGDRPLPDGAARYEFGPFTPAPTFAPPPAGTLAWPAPLTPPVPAAKKRSPLVIALVVLLAVVVAGSGTLVVLSQLGDGIGYRNDGYTAPPINTDPPTVDGPRTEDEAYQTIEHNALYGQSVVQPIRCEVPTVPHAASMSAAELKTWLEEASACLMTVWHTPVEGAGLQLYRAGVTTYGTSLADTPCGDLKVNAAFCGADQQFYWSTELLPLLAGRDRALLTADSTVLMEILAHEFGHAVQYRAGITQSVAGLRGLLGRDSEDGKQVNRRLELQADCFAGLFLRAVSRSLDISDAQLAMIKVAVHASGDTRASGDHGQPDNRSAWFQLGLDSMAVGACNTFVAPQDRVK